MKLARLFAVLVLLSFGICTAQTFTSTTPYVCQAGNTEAFPETDPTTFHCQGIPYYQDPANPNIYQVVFRTFTLGGRTLVSGSGITWSDSAWVPFTVTLNNETDQNCPIDPLPNAYPGQPAKTCGSFAFTAYPVDTNGVTHMMTFQGNWINHRPPANSLAARWNYPEYTYSETTVN